MPASGKTTLARALGSELQLPVIEKDEIKEVLFDTLGAGDVGWSRKLGTATYPLLLTIAGRLLAVGSSVILEANFFRGTEHGFESLPPCTVVQIHCSAPLDVLVERFRSRPSRHAGHLDDQRVSELRARYESGANGPLALSCELIEVDTTAFVDVAAVAARVANPS
jgi:predicted kinase